MDLLLERDETAITITRKVVQEFVGPSVDESFILRLSNVFRTSGYSTKALLNAIFESDEFWRKENRGRLVKSPIRFVVDSFRIVQLERPEWASTISSLKLMQQELFNPPNVEGWSGGVNWITSGTLLERNKFATRLLKQFVLQNPSLKKLTMSSMGETNIGQTKQWLFGDLDDVRKFVLVEKLPLVGNGSEGNQIAADFLLEPAWNLY